MSLCLSCQEREAGEGEALCPRCEADEVDAWQAFDRVLDDREAAIETLREMLLDEARMRAARASKRPPVFRTGDARSLPGQACLAIALALLL